MDVATRNFDDCYVVQYVFYDVVAVGSQYILSMLSIMYSTSI